MPGMEKLSNSKEPSEGAKRLRAAIIEARAAMATPPQSAVPDDNLKRLADYRNAIRFEFQGAPDTALFGDREAAVILDTTTSVLGLWRLGKRGPNWVRIGKSPKYQKSDLLRFIASGERQ